MKDEDFKSPDKIEPTSMEAIATFARNHRDAAGFEITYMEDGIDRVQLCHSISPYAVWMERPWDGPALQCTPLGPIAAQLTVPLGDIKLLTVAEPPPDLYTAGAETPDEEARGLRRLAKADPNAVPLPPLIALLDVEYDSVFGNKDAVQALRRVAAVRPEDCKPAIPILRSLLSRETLHARAEAITTLRYIGDKDPEAIAPLADDLLPYLHSKNFTSRRNAIRCFAAIAGEYPEDAIEAVPALATAIEGGVDGIDHAAHALSLITREYPEGVKPVTGTLREAVIDDSLSDTTRLNATAALGRIVGEHPSVGVEIVDDVAVLLDVSNHKLRNNAIGLIGDVALLHADVVEPYTKKIVPLLAVDDAYTRINASCALSRVAEDFPDSVDHVVPIFTELLADEEPLVRTNACWALGHLCAQEATSTLEDRAHNDDNTDVRTRASWALARIDQ